MTTEQWRPVRNYRGYYEVSSLGRVRSLDRAVKTKRGIWNYKGCILQPGLYEGGYPLVVLNKAGVKKTKGVHVLVAEAFLPPKPTPKHEVNHKDNNRSNSRADNLEWMTHKENSKYSIVTGNRKWFVSYGRRKRNPHAAF